MGDLLCKNTAAFHVSGQRSGGKLASILIDRAWDAITPPDRSAGPF